MTTNDLKALIRDVPDFPKKGIVFKDITPLLSDVQGLRTAIDRLTEHYRNTNVSVVVGAEARGFILGPPVALNLNAGFVPVRKPGKLPYKTKSVTYDLEYGTDTVEIHEDAIKPGQEVLMLDDVLATGGTMAACCKLVESMGGRIVGCAFLLELTFLNGRKALDGRDVFSLIQY
ncbi:MAG: adenine phosphoribosyltransferase [Candidatus Bathyanammoxibius sp.]